MNRGFKYLIDMYGVNGARSKFEEICQQLMQRIFGLAYMVQCYPGDDGIDIYINGKEEMIVYQCKYFTDRIEDSQKDQIRESLEMLMKSIHKDRVKKWILCVPTILTSKEHDWWIRWSNKKAQEYNIDIELIDEANLLNLLRINNLYAEHFEIIEIDKNMIKEFSKEKYIKDMATFINDIATNDFRNSNVEFVSLCDEIVRRYMYDPFFKNSNLIVAIDCLSDLITYAQNGIITDQKILDEIKLVRKEILEEYSKMFY